MTTAQEVLEAIRVLSSVRQRIVLIRDAENGKVGLMAAEHDQMRAMEETIVRFAAEHVACLTPPEASTEPGEPPPLDPGEPPLDPALTDLLDNATKPSRPVRRAAAKKRPAKKATPKKR